MTHRPRIAVACVAAALCLSACQPTVPTPDPSPPSPVFGKAVVIGIHSDQPGWGRFIPPNSYSGFDYDLGNWLANRSGFKATYSPIASGDREQLLKSGQVGLVIATYSITDDRKKEVGQAGPYMITQQGVMIRTGYDKIRNSADFQGKNICTAEGTTSQIQLEAMGFLPVIRPGYDQCRDDLLKGLVDAVSTDQLVLYGYARIPGSGLSVVPGVAFGNQERYGIGYPLGDEAKCDALIAAIRTFLAEGHWDRFFQANLPGITSEGHRPNPNVLNPCQ